MKNVVIFGAVQSGKSTLMGYIASASLNERSFSEAAQQKEKAIRGMEIGQVKSDMILPSFISMDRDELKDFAEKNAPGTSKRIHRKSICVDVDGMPRTNRYTFIDTPGSRDRQSEQFSGMFEGELGLCVLSAIDVDHYFSLDPVEDKEKFHSERRRLFSPIQFWNVYKGSENLIIILSKIDFFDDRISQLEEIYNRLTWEIETICTSKVLIIPTSIRLYKRFDLYSRKEQNIFYSDKMGDWYGGPSLIEELAKKLWEITPIVPTAFRLATAIKICLIPNSSNYALRVKCLQGNLSMHDKLILGPLQSEQKKQVYLDGTVKSLKIEDAELAQQLPEGTIGGVAFTQLNLSGNKSNNQLLQNYKLLPTTVLMSGKHITGNILRIRIKEDELGDSTIDALLQVLPKSQIEFYWLGKRMFMDLIEHYEENGYLYFSLANLSAMASDNSREFALPLLEDGYPFIECPVVMQYNEYRLVKKLEKCRANAHALFHVVNIFSFENNSKYTVRMITHDSFSSCSIVSDYFSDIKNVHVSKSKEGELVILIYDITAKSAHKCYKKLHDFAADEGLSEYQLYLYPQIASNQ